MPTLSLYTTPAHPDAWHRVIAPGGYEWWHFEADDDSTELRVTADFFDGDPFDANYLRAYARFRRRPTRFAPPVPRDYPRVRMSVREKNQPVAEFTARFSPGTFRGSDVRPDVQIGRNTMASEAEGVFHLSLQEMHAGPGSNIKVDMVFRAAQLDLPAVRELPSPDGTTGKHFRVVNDRRWDVTGTIRLTSSHSVNRSIALQGHGRFDHRFGGGPIVLEQF